MLELFDFSSLLQVVIAFYCVYAISSKDILNTFVFSFIHGSLKKLKEKSDKQFLKAKNEYEAIKKDESEIDKVKLSDAQKNLMKTSLMGAKQEYDIASSLNEGFSNMLKLYEGKSFFSVLAVDMIVLCVVLMVMGVLDHKMVRIADDICFMLIMVVAILQLHCYLYEFSYKIRNVRFLTPTVIGHLVIMSLCIIGAFYCFDDNIRTFGQNSDITVYMLIFAVLVVTPPIIVLGRHYMLYNRLNNILKHSEKSMEWAMKWFHRDVSNYKEMYHLDTNQIRSFEE